MKTLSIIHNFTQVIEEKTLDLILLEIRTGFYREAIASLRRHIHYNELGHYENYKKALTTFTPSGIFKVQNDQIILLKYSQYILLDTERISPTEIFIASKMLMDDPHTLAYFKSPSGKSLKIIVEVNSAWAYHKEAFMQVMEHYSKLISHPIVSSGRDLTQLCFFSYDPELYQNPKHTIFQIEIPNY